MKLNANQQRENSNIQNSINELDSEMVTLSESQCESAIELDKLQHLLNKYLPSNFLEDKAENSKLTMSIEECICEVNKITSEKQKQFRLPAEDLTGEDIFVASLAGIIAAVIDIFLVGTPEVVKIWKEGERFDGSVLTGWLRRIGNGENSKLKPIFDWFCDTFSVPYDISLESGVVTPNNHRLRCFAHDPLFGLFFAIFDIFMKTTTCIDNKGMIRILPSSKEVPLHEKILAGVYYFGHLVSDVYTARGLPIPGFFLTQFFTGEGEIDSIAKTVERMYFDGYDVRHLASMSAPVIVKNNIIKIYLALKYSVNIDISLCPISYKEILEYEKEARIYKMRLIADGIATSGNILKFFMPITMGNPTAFNLPEWFALIRDGVVVAKHCFRDKSAEKIIHGREIIEENWSVCLT